jgi:hypothetical protein
MKTKLLLTLFLTASPALLHAQGGSLTPPAGPILPTMKSLDVVEARTPLVAGAPGVTVDGVTGAITITAPGSYYLTGNLTTTGTASCINVGNHTCTIDLNGFIVSRTTGTESGSAGILIAGASGQKVMIRNGHIRGGGTSAGFATAILKSGGDLGSVHVENVHCANVRNGIVLNYLDGRNTVRNCSVENSGGEGIRAEVVTGCVVNNTVLHGIFGDIITECTVKQTLPEGTRHGIIGGLTNQGRGIVNNCSVWVQNGTGIRARTVTASMAYSSASGTAILADLVTNSVAESFAGVAINATTAVGCHVVSGSVSITNKYNMP